MKQLWLVRDNGLNAIGIFRDYEIWSGEKPDKKTMFYDGTWECDGIKCSRISIIEDTDFNKGTPKSVHLPPGGGPIPITIVRAD